MTDEQEERIRYLVRSVWRHRSFDGGESQAEEEMIEQLRSMVQTEERKFLHALLEAQDMDGVRAMCKTRLQELDDKRNIKRYAITELHNKNRP